ncbi:I78 family peptidase inhibitor [Streptomyces sp. NPDC059564]|uniref:I78 family peptidase inhibitor n=1 Tax=Streptomyces sp. NPDC059564 TaxID=3346865 RepID=UPI0036813724
MTAPASSPTPGDDPARYVGLDADEAELQARRNGWTTLRMVPPGTILTMEHLEGRLNFEVEGHRVVRAWKG